LIKFVVRNPLKNKMDNFSFLNAAHSAYFADLYDQYLENPDSLEPSWRAFFSRI
jgi:2-oxoglutarate dehydrogenase complex dehydrogenase (E1) component-like enzyme